MIDTSPEALAKLRADLAEIGGIFAVSALFDTMLALIDALEEARTKQEETREHALSTKRMFDTERAIRLGCEKRSKVLIDALEEARKERDRYKAIALEYKPGS